MSSPQQEAAPPSQRDRINAALSCSPVDTAQLRLLSRKGDGFLSSSLRSRVWPKLLQVNRYHLQDYKRYVRVHRDAAQLRCDIDRSFWSLDCAKGWSKKRLAKKRAVLSDIITAVLVRNPTYYYFQGFHDIVSVLMLVFQDNILVFGFLEAMCQKYLSDFMRKDFTVLSRVMRFADAELSAHLEEAHTEPFFATSWLITWLSHDIRNIHEISRVFDVFLCSPPEYSLYFCAALVLQQKDKLMSIETEFSSIHNFLSRILRPGLADATSEHEICPERNRSSSNSENRKSPKSTSSLPFDFFAVVQLADTLLEQLPPSALFDMADSDLQCIVVETKTLMFNGMELSLSNSIRMSVMSHVQPFSSDLVLRSAGRIVRHYWREKWISSNSVGWLTIFDSTYVDRADDNTCGSVSTETNREIIRKEDNGENSRRIALLAFSGGLLSFAVWFLQHKNSVNHP